MFICQGFESNIRHGLSNSNIKSASILWREYFVVILL